MQYIATALGNAANSVRHLLYEFAEMEGCGVELLLCAKRLREVATVREEYMTAAYPEDGSEPKDFYWMPTHLRLEALGYLRVG
jgi:hypothetical protein